MRNVTCYILFFLLVYPLLSFAEHTDKKAILKGWMML